MMPFNDEAFQWQLRDITRKELHVILYILKSINRYITSDIFTFLLGTSESMSPGRGQGYWSFYRQDYTPPLNVYRIATR